MISVKISSIGNSLGVILPKEVLAMLRVGKGDVLHITETPGGVQLVPHDEQFEREMQVAEGVMREYRDVLKKLAE